MMSRNVAYGIKLLLEQKPRTSDLSISASGGSAPNVTRAGILTSFGSSPRIDNLRRCLDICRVDLSQSLVIGYYAPCVH